MHKKNILNQNLKRSKQSHCRGLTKFEGNEDTRQEKTNKKTK